MVVTRSMSGKTKKPVDTKIAVNDKDAKRASKQRRIGKTQVLIMTGTNKADSKKVQKFRVPCISVCLEDTTYFDAQDMFMMDYVKQYYEKHPPRPTVGLVPWDILTGGFEVWKSMSDSEKAPYIEHAKKKKDVAYLRTLLSQINSTCINQS